MIGQNVTIKQNKNQLQPIRFDALARMLNSTLHAVNRVIIKLISRYFNL